ncbi:MAG TPA: FtsX-like permease family protein, partial [Acidobacteriaceae bacterium]|nr:FtsX-like permease family protein [Acidobacteriaceae bacterium]
VAPLVSHALGAMLLSGARESHLDTSLDVRVFAFAALMAVTATLVIGLVPALRATSRDLNEQIKSGQHSTQKQERHRWLPRALMSVEVALALVLVVGAGLLASTLVRLYRSGEGFDPHGVQNVAFSMEKSGMNHASLMAFYQQIGEGLRRVPGVTAVSFARIVPLTGYVWDEDMSASGGKPTDTYFNAVGPGYFSAMRIPLREGRDFGWNETTAEGGKIVLNAQAAKLLFPHGGALGRIVNRSRGPKESPLPYEVVGVVGDAKYEDLRSQAPPAAYTAMTQEEGKDSPSSYYAVVRTSGDAGSVASAARKLAQHLAPGIPAPVTTSMMTTVDDSLSAERMMALLSVFFAACALLVTAIGLYGTLAYATARRTSEIGIRMALGARRSQVVGLVCSQNALVALVGTAVGLIAALLASKALASFLYGTGAQDPWVLIGSVAALAVIASAASLLPALRAARINPVVAIRCE